MNWVSKDKNNIWHPFTPLEGVEDPLYIESATGAYLITEDGRKIIDAVSSWWVNLHGHSHPHITKAIADQAKKLEHVIFAGFTHQPAIRLAENLISILPDNQSKIFYSDNGSTSVEVALKMAFQYWYNQDIKKNKVIAIDGAYHGDTFGAMSVGERGEFTKPFFPQLFEVDFIDFPTEENEQDVFNQFKDFIATGEVASFIFEPIIQGASGMRIYRPEFLDKLMAYAKSHGVVCIADEVMTGFGRTGKLFASDYLENKPDIMCLSKGLTGGAMALGVTACTEDIVDAFKTPELIKTFLHGHSFTANPIACAAANASFDLLMTDNCKKNIKRIEHQHQAFKNDLTEDARIKEVRTIGTILAIEFNTSEGSSYLSEMRNKLYPYFLSKDILLRPLGNLIYIIPPYVINDEDLSKVYKAIKSFISEL